MSGKLFHDRTRDPKLSFGRLIWVRGRANRDTLSGAHLLQFLPQQPCAMFLNVDFALKFQSVAHFHELVRIARIAIFAGELAAAVRIDLPGEGHARRVTACEQAAIFQRK